MPRVSVIIPVRNEASRLPLTLARIGGGDPEIEVIVVDGGSDDGSAAVAARAGARVIGATVRQRAAQMNLGAAEARGDVFLFLHADTILPEGWYRALTTSLGRDSASVGGAFRRRFDSPSWILRLTCLMADWRGSLFGAFLGDQAIFARREVFQTLGGFGPLRVFEDLDFSMRMARMGRTTLVRSAITTSARRFAALGPLRQTLADVALTIRFFRNRDAFIERL